MTSRAVTLQGPRVRLRPWRLDGADGDLDTFAALNADPRVMAFLPQPLSRDESAAMMGRLQARIDAQGWGLWAAEVDGGCIGFIGLSVPSFDAHFTPCVEVGWRLAASAWGHGYATEGAGLALAHGFDVLGLDEILSFTTVDNARSRAVMARLGMTHDPADDFDHPRLAGHRLERHVLYRLRRLTLAHSNAAHEK
jgi:ribosomal-protein-alanine N-acetyltransferase